MASSSLVLTLAMALTSPTDARMEKIVPVTETACNAIAWILQENDIICIFRSELGKDGLVVAVPKQAARCSLQDLDSGSIGPDLETIMEVNKDCNTFLQDLAKKRAEPPQGKGTLLLQKIRSLFLR